MWGAVLCTWRVRAFLGLHTLDVSRTLLSKWWHTKQYPDISKSAGHVFTIRKALALSPVYAVQLDGRLDGPLSVLLRLTC